MAYQLVYKKRFYNKLSKLLNYLEESWNTQVAAEFLQKLDKRTNTLKLQPLIGTPSQMVKMSEVFQLLDTISYTTKFPAVQLSF